MIQSRRTGLPWVAASALLAFLNMGGCPGDMGAVDHTCQLDADCDDGRFCNGGETCGHDGGCVDGESPCPAEDCIESADFCPDCTTDEDCPNPAFCDGMIVRCEDSECVSTFGGEPPCDNFCDELNDTCTDTPPTDNDGCADFGEACETDEDCCNGLPCVGGHCV